MSDPMGSQAAEMSYAKEEFSELRNLIKKHKVCWEVWPEFLIDHQGKKVQIGFELDLMGTHHDPENPPIPDCEECVKVYKDLKKISHWIIPQEDCGSRYDIGIFDSTIHYAARRRFRPDVALTIKITHREGFDRPPEDCEVKVLQKMEEKLKMLGAQKGEWVESIREL